MRINVTPLPGHLSSLRASAEILGLLKRDNVLKHYPSDPGTTAHSARAQGKDYKSIAEDYS